MSVADPILHLGGDGGVLCVWFLVADLLLAVALIALIAWCPGFMDSADASGM